MTKAIRPAPSWPALAHLVIATGFAVPLGRKRSKRAQRAAHYHCFMIAKTTAVVARAALPPRLPASLVGVRQRDAHGCEDWWPFRVVCLFSLSIECAGASREHGRRCARCRLVTRFLHRAGLNQVIEDRPNGSPLLATGDGARGAAAVGQVFCGFLLAAPRRLSPTATFWPVSDRELKVSIRLRADIRAAELNRRRPSRLQHECSRTLRRRSGGGGSGSGRMLGAAQTRARKPALLIHAGDLAAGTGGRLSGPRKSAGL